MKEQQTESFYDLTASLLLEQNMSPEEAQQVLVDRGLSEERAYTIVNSVVNGINQAYDDERKSERFTRIIRGLLICIAGIAVTAITYSMAADGGYYVVAWGAIIFGAIDFFRGVFNL